VDAAYERYLGLDLCEYEMTLYYIDGSNMLNATVNGKALGREAALILRDAMTRGAESAEEWLLHPWPERG
jgi:hypothetical protein